MGNRHSGENRSGLDQKGENTIKETTIHDLPMQTGINERGYQITPKPQSFVKPGFRFNQESTFSLPKNRSHSMRIETRQWSSNNHLEGRSLSCCDDPERTELLSSSRHSLGAYPVKLSKNQGTEREKEDSFLNQKNKNIKTMTGRQTKPEQANVRGKTAGLRVRKLVTPVPITKPMDMNNTSLVTNLINKATNATGDNNLDSELNSYLQSITSLSKILDQPPLTDRGNTKFSKHYLFRTVKQYTSCFSNKLEHSFRNLYPSKTQIEDESLNVSLPASQTTATMITSDGLKAQGDQMEHNSDHSSPNLTPESLANSSDHSCRSDGLSQLENSPLYSKHSLYTAESMENLKLFIHSMQIEQDGLQQQYQSLKTECDLITQEVNQLHARLSAGRSAGLKLEADNGRLITGSLKHKYLQAEKNQLQLELDRRKLLLDKKETERRELSLEYDRLQRLKTISQRQCQEALMESNLTMQQLREISDKCSTMEVHKDEGDQLRNMIYNLQEVMGRIRVIVSLKATAHESCLEYISSSELAFTASTKGSGCEFQGNKSSEEQDFMPVLCKLSHVVCPGSCSALEVYNDVSTTIDGVINGFNALFVAAGPSQSGKTTSIFGELDNRFSRLEISNHQQNQNQRFHTTFKERRANLKHAAKSRTSQFMDLSHSEEFASCYGLLGLCLVHLIQNVSIKSIIELQADDLSRLEYHISVSVITVPLDVHIPVTDLVTNKIAKPNQSTSTQSGTEDPLVSFHLKQKSIASISEVILLCELIQNRLRAAQANSTDRGRRVPAHTVVTIRVERPTKLVKDSKLASKGFLTLVDTVGLDGDAVNQVSGANTDIQQPVHAWKDVKALAQIMRINPNPVWFEKNRLLYTLRPCIFGRGQSTETACTLLLHLPCDQSQAYTTLQCLRLGLWVMYLDRNRGENQKSVAEDKQSRDDEKPQRQCVWRIGVIGQRLPSSRDRNNTTLSPRFTPLSSSTSAGSRGCVSSRRYQTRQLSSSSLRYPTENGSGGRLLARHISPPR